MAERFNLDKTHVVYRFFDHEDHVLYVGVTSQGFERMIQHAKKSAFFKYMAGMRSVQHYATRDEALAAERALIQRQKPPFNQVHNPDWPHCRDSYIARQEPAFAARLADPVAAMAQDLGHRLELESIGAGRAYMRAVEAHEVAARLLFTAEHPVVGPSGNRVGTVSHHHGCVIDIDLDERGRFIVAGLVTFSPERRGSRTWFRVESVELAFEHPARWAKDLSLEAGEEVA